MKRPTRKQLVALWREFDALIHPTLAAQFSAGLNPGSKDYAALDAFFAARARLAAALDRDGELEATARFLAEREAEKKAGAAHG